MDFSKTKPSKNFEDRRSMIVPQYDWIDHLFWQLMKANYQDGRRGDGSYTLRDPSTYEKPFMTKR